MTVSFRFLAGTAFVALAGLPCLAHAGESAAAPQASAPAVNDIVVTGSSRAQRRFGVSYAVNALDGDQIRKLAPRSMTELIGALPGIQVEATGGEVQNITRVRGIPTDRGYLYYQQDGLPLYHELDGYFFNQGDGMNRLDLMTQRVEVVRGGPAPIHASTAAGIANVITRTGGDVAQGEAQLTLGTSGLYRLDAFQSGKLAKDTYFALGGFVRLNEGYRDSGFPADKGGQIRANILHKLDNGSIKLSGQYTNDRNTFYLSIPTADPRNPSLSLSPYIDFFTGTLNSSSLRNVSISYKDGSGNVQTQKGDLANGRHMEFGNAGLDYEGDFGPWHVSVKAGYTKGKNHFDALYSTSNPVDASTYAASYLTAAQSAFGSGVTRLGYALAGANGQSAYTPASGLVLSAQYRSVEARFHSSQGDLSVTRKFETALGQHDIRVGVYGARYGSTAFAVYQNYLMPVASNPPMLDLVAYSSSGAVLGYVTDNGAINDAVSLVGGKFNGQVKAVYASDSWDITRHLRVDLGLRREWYDYEGYYRATTSANLGNAATLADNSTRAFTGQIVNQSYSANATNWTVGANYDLDGHWGAYARASQMEVPAGASAVMNATMVTTKTTAKLYEAGLKASFGRSYLYLTGFYTKFDPLSASFTAYVPSTGRSDQTVNFTGTARNIGIEADGRWQVAGPFSLAGSFTVQDPRYLNFTSTTGADASKANGKQMLRQSKIYANIRPSLDFASHGAKISLYGRYDYVGRRFVDYPNTTALPAYGYFGVGVMAEKGLWTGQIVGDNITNAHGLTEGNTAGDVLAGQGNATAIFGRPLFGRSFRLVVSRKW
ncbi:TonB-dependent receptor [Novosphingobium umbonatum]|uniref:TonB-dependent receptor n=1 Tax=Novosphingobium umbonatum TaxID=1908524 RepID=A0A437MXH6_9SPHN|nr:TonB-dependent receptor [Novosphingobium umbonatum]RVU02316.1 TonB-dependent receptor [Novosphingobium umbonatum]